MESDLLLNNNTFTKLKKRKMYTLYYNPRTGKYQVNSAKKLDVPKHFELVSDAEWHNTYRIFVGMMNVIFRHSKREKPFDLEHIKTCFADYVAEDNLITNF